MRQARIIDVGPARDFLMCQYHAQAPEVEPYLTTLQAIGLYVYRRAACTAGAGQVHMELLQALDEVCYRPLPHAGCAVQDEASPASRCHCCCQWPAWYKQIRHTLGVHEGSCMSGCCNRPRILVCNELSRCKPVGNPATA